MKSKRQLNLAGPLNCVTYGRYSSEVQNPRSVTQQQGEILRELVRQNRPWKTVAEFSDEGVSGRLVGKRPGFMAMVKYIDKHPGQVDAILVDTMERLGRSESIEAIRQHFLRQGVVVLVAQKQFMDPTTLEGSLLQFLDAARGVQENEIKGYVVSRGKWDAVEQGFWPGGPVPLGFELAVASIERRGSREVIRKKLVPADATKIVIQKIYALAATNGWGSYLIAKALRNDLTVPEECRKLAPNTIDRILTNPIYTGCMLWAKNSTDYEDDMRTIKPNPESEWLVKADFCEPLVPFATFQAIHVLRAARAAGRKPRPPANANGAAPGCQGVALKYALSGLVVCQKCGRSMVVQSRRDSEGKVLVKPIYRCPSARLTDCPNRTGVPYQWLLDQVLHTVTAAMFGVEKPIGDPLTVAEVQGSPMYAEFYGLVQAELARLDAADPSERDGLEAEQQQLQRKKLGLCESFATPNLPATLRATLTETYQAVEARLAEIEALLLRMSSRREMAVETCSPDRVATVLSKLSEALAGDNPSVANVELSKHLDQITVASDGSIQIRLCKLGLLSDLSLMPTRPDEMTTSSDQTTRNRPRRLVPNATDANPLEFHLRPDYSINLNRFRHLSDEWFWEYSLTVPKRLSWIEEHAVEVAQSRMADPCSIDALAARFDVSDTTIEKALRRAKDLGVDATQIDGRQLQSNWAEDHAEEVAAYVEANGGNKSEAARHFGKSPAWIRRAVTNAMRKRNSSQAANGDAMNEEAA